MLWVLLLTGVAPPHGGAHPVLQDEAPAASEEGASDARSAVRLEGAYTADGMANVGGGADTGAALMDNLDVSASINLDALGWVPQTDVFVYGLGNQGGSISDDVGDVQGVDNIETVNAWRLYEAFIQYRSPQHHVSVLGGLYDVNSEFAALQTARVFVNSSFGIGAAFALSRDKGPSIFPFTSLGVRVRAVPGPTWYVQGALLDGRPGETGDPRGHPLHFESNDGVLIVGEAGWSTPSSGPATNPAAMRRQRVSRFGERQRRAHVGVGVWYYSATFDPVAVPRNALRGNRGAYLLGDVRLFAEDDPSTGALHAFVQLGYADDRVNRIAAYTGGGVVYTGLLPTRPEDKMGLGLAAAHNGADYKRRQRRLGTPVDAAEWTTESTYAAVVTPWLTIQGDAQYVRHPETRPSRADALVLGLRIKVTP